MCVWCMHGGFGSALGEFGCVRMGCVCQARSSAFLRQGHTGVASSVVLPSLLCTEAGHTGNTGVYFSFSQVLWCA